MMVYVGAKMVGGDGGMRGSAVVGFFFVGEHLVFRGWTKMVDVGWGRRGEWC